MFNIEDILSEDYSKYPEDAKEYLIKFNQKLRESIKEELIQDKMDMVMKNVNNDKEYLVGVLEEILENGFKGYNNMSTRALVNTYLSQKDQQDFIGLIEKVSNALS
ncbi:hypothetical protein IAI10_14840 [Clostridium sp. 19966]|nr:hypothetical protein [Clostridium sp. 19966]